MRNVTLNPAGAPAWHVSHNRYAKRDTEPRRDG
jgi:hypothetical protein